MPAAAVFVLILLSLSLPARADAPYSLSLGFPLYDSAQYPVSGFSPSLGTAHALTQDFYLGMHWGLATAFGTTETAMPHPFETFSIIALDYLSGYYAPGSTWLHEEAHRAVLNRYGISSHNGVYATNLGDGAVPVDRVRDADLIELKHDHPADFVRLSTAGMEAESQLALNLEKAQFFDKALPRQRFLILLSHLGPISYRSFCDSRDGDIATFQDLQEEGPDESERDFTGYDCVSYVYDLYRPYEAYEDRGPHPSGVGIARYRSRDDLTSSEKVYLHRMGIYSYLNLIDPFMFHFSGWNWGEHTWAATLRHHLAPFGHSLEENVFIRGASGKHLLILKQYTNRHATMPGVEWQTFDDRFDVRSGLWLQPQSLLFASRRWQPGGFLAVRYKQSWTDHFGYFAEFMTKTRGWMADEVDLGPATHVRVGVSVHL